MPDALTHQDKMVRRAFIEEAAADHPGNYLAAIQTGAARFRAHRQRIGRAVTETSAARAPKLSKRLRRIADAVIAETLTAAQAPKPAPAAAAAPGSRTPASDTPAHELDADQLAAATAQAFTGKSPFWDGQVRESSASAPVTESASGAPDTPLHLLDSDTLAAHATAAFSAYGRAQAFGSPGWLAAPASG